MSVEPADDRIADLFPDDPPEMAWRVTRRVVFPLEWTLALIVTKHWGEVKAELLEEGGGVITPIYSVSDGIISGWVRGELA